MKKFTVQIVGGGLAGLSLACCLGKKNIPTLLIDNQKNPNRVDIGDRRTTALMHSSVAFLKNLGVWDSVKDASYKLNKMRMIPINPPYSMGESISFDSSTEKHTTLAYNTDNHELRKAMCQQISKYDCVEHLFECTANGGHHTNDGWIINTSAGDFIADLSVGCDGRKSIIREIAGITTEFEDYSQSAIVFNVNHTVAHDNSSTEFMYPEGAFTFVPMGDNCSSIVWVETTDMAIQYINDTDLLFKQLVKKSQNVFGELEIITDIQAFPLNQIMAQSNIAKNLCLMGEAHHGLTPVAAQGLNLSLRDSAVLAETIINSYASGGTVGNDKTLQAYSRKRKADISSRAFATKAFHKISRQSDPLSLGIKSIGIGLLNRLPAVKKTVVNAGLSFPGGVPLYMQDNTEI